MAVYSMDSLHDNCYPDTTILINKLDIHNQSLLDEAEQTITAINYAEVDNTLEFTGVDFEYYKKIHWILFKDIYDWAGSIRTIDISKRGTSFCKYSEIEILGSKRFERLCFDNYLLDMPFEKFTDEFTDLYVDLNYLHPFREGNGRTHRLFLTLLSRNAGYNIDFSKIDTDLLMIATIQSAQGSITLLKQVLADLLK